MCELDLAVVVGGHERFRALKDAEPAALKTGGVFARRNSFAAGFDTDHADGFVIEKGMEDSNRVAAAADARAHNVGQPAFPFQDLLARFDADDALKIADHHRIWMRAE